MHADTQPDSAKPEVASSDTHFLQPKITGYRQLTYVDTALMNEAKELEAAYSRLHQKIKAHIADQRKASHQIEDPAARGEEQVRMDNAEPERWLAMARTSVQLGVMQMVRSIAQPVTP